MVAIDDVSAWFVTAFNADASLSTLVPGKIVAERPNEFAVQPYGACSVELDGAVPFSSGPRYYPKFRLTVKVWCDQNTTADARAIEKRFEYVFQQIPKVTLTLRNGKVVSMVPNAASAKFDPKPRNKNDVVICQFGRLVRCSGRTDSE